MRSGTDHRRPAVALAALIGSAVLFSLGTGLQPVWWLTWLAPLPVLLVAPRTSAVRAASVAAAAHLLGMAGFARYLLAGLAMPIPVVAALLVVTAGVFAGVVLLFRALLRRGRPTLAVLAAPAVWAGAEYLMAALTPFGSNWAVANSQADALPVLQVVAVTGPWGVAFVVLAVACAIGVLAAPALELRARLRAAGVGALVLVGALGFGTARLAFPDVRSVSWRPGRRARPQRARTPIVALVHRLEPMCECRCRCARSSGASVSAPHVAAAPVLRVRRPPRASPPSRRTAACR